VHEKSIPGSVSSSSLSVSFRAVWNMSPSHDARRCRDVWEIVMPALSAGNVSIEEAEDSLPGVVSGGRMVAKPERKEHQASHGVATVGQE